MTASLVLAIDQGTTSSRAIVFDGGGGIVSQAQEEFAQHFPRSGWVEHEPEDLWLSVLRTCRAAIEDGGIDIRDIAAIGITNQRETTLVWDRDGRPVHRAIVWQDRRTAEHCARMRRDGLEDTFTRVSGLLIDPYFSGTKVAWILDHVEGARERAKRGELLFGTVDTWLIWRLTGGERHVTDATNAARTLMFDIARGDWSDELLGHLGVPRAMLPEVLDCAAEFGTAAPEHLGRAIPVLGVAGDQQAATIGNACFEPGMVKSTYGTGCFALLNTGNELVPSRNRMLTTIAYRLDGETTYALEGSIFMAGATVQWLRDGLGLIERAEESGTLAAEADEGQDVVMVPAFTGLGAPYWDAEARGAVFGMTRATGPAEFARATLEAVCFQTADLLSAMRDDWAAAGASYAAPPSDAAPSADAESPSDAEPAVLRVDGGMVASDWTMQFLADILDRPVDRPTVLETTALGAAWLAGWKAGVWPGREGFARTWKRERRFEPAMDAPVRERKLELWRDAVRRTLTTY